MMFSFVIKKYTGSEYWYLNNYLRQGEINYFTEKEFKYTKGA